MIRSLLCLIMIVAATGCQSNDPRHRLAEIDKAIARGVDYLVKSQNPDGSWGSATETRGWEVYNMVPGTFDGMRVGTSSLCVMALREAGEKQAHDRGLQHLWENYQARRDTGDLIYNLWAHIYCTQALAIENRIKQDPRNEKVVNWHIDYLRRYETYIGGWNYYDFDYHTQIPSMGPTSFGTAAALVALDEAKKSGFKLPDQMAERATRRLAEMRLPSGAFIYSQDHQYRPLSMSDQVRGSVGRIQPCDDALWLWNSPEMNRERVVKGLEIFAKEHIFLDMGRKRPMPHEAWYQTAAYYYYYDHYYAARLCERLGWQEARRHWPAILDGILPYQEEDGSWWDFAMWGYHKPYGTAFAVMALIRCREQILQQQQGR